MSSLFCFMPFNFTSETEKKYYLANKKLRKFDTKKVNRI
jgi:hypothetical protein